MICGAVFKWKMVVMGPLCKLGSILLVSSSDILYFNCSIVWTCTSWNGAGVPFSPGYTLQLTFFWGKLGILWSTKLHCWSVMYEIHFYINPPKLTCKKYFTFDPDVTVNFIIIVNRSIYILHFIILELLSIREKIMLKM